MIKNITSNWQGLIIGNPIKTNISMSVASAGMVRYHIDHFEVYDGYSWVGVEYDASIDLSYETRAILEWARKKMAEETAIEKLKDNPAIADLLKQKADIDEKLKIVEVLIRDHNGTN